LESYRVAATAYILRALVLSGTSPENTAIKSGAGFIEKVIAKYNESFSMALSLDALMLAGGSGTVTGPLAERLTKAAQDEGNGAVSWTYGAKDDWVGRYHRGDNSVETTGYAVMALARSNAGVAVVQGGAKYLVLSRGAGGFYGSTHNTAVAFSALNRLSELTPLKSMTVEVLVNGATINTVTIDQSNKDLTFLTDLRPWFTSSEGPLAQKTVSVTLRSTGEGGVFYHLYTKQHIDWTQAVLPPAPELTLTVRYSSTNATVGTQISAVANVSYNGPATGLQMVLVDLRAPTGFVLDETNFDDMLSRGVISFYEFRGGGQALVYLDSLRQAQSKRLEYTLTAMTPATSLLQHVNAFDMYNTTLSVELQPVGFRAI